MNLLILGGTQFVGRHIAQAALAQGHQTTLFHRGKTRPDLFPQAEHLQGDRDGGLDALRSRRWDAVVDVSGYVPRIVQQTAALLRDTVPFYCFVSSVSVYADLSMPHQTEDAPLNVLPADIDADTCAVTPDTYGALKVLCETVVRDAYGGQSLVIRPGLVAGPHDPTDRFTYWPLRASLGGAMLMPGPPDPHIQTIDARDLAEWTLRMVSQKCPGTFNAVTDDPALTLGALVTEGARQAQADVHAVPMDEAWLLARGLAPWQDLPLWVPTQTTSEYRGFSTISPARALAAGLTYRPLSETVSDTLSWAKAAGLQLPLKAGLSREREAELLQAWEKEEGKMAPPP